MTNEDTKDMYGNWVLKIYPKGYKKATIERICKRKDLKIQDTCCSCNYIEKPKNIIKKLKKAGIPYSCYKVEYERATNYRQVFFARTSAPYRCRYCNRKLKSKKEVYVDHIIPVAKVQKKWAAQALLKIAGCNNINSIQNLAPACLKCNLKKSDHMGFWIIRGWAGRYQAYWFFIWIARITILLAIIGLYIWVILANH